MLAAPIALDEIERRFADRIENRDEVTFDEKSLSLRARRSRRLGAIALAEQTRKVEPNDETARLLAEGVARAGIGKLPWTKALTQWRDRVMFLRRAEGDEWPDLSDAALAANIDWLVPAFADKTALSQLAPDDLHSALTELSPLAAAPPPRRRSADAFRGADRHAMRRSTTRPRPGRRSRSACRSCSASRSIPRSPAGAFRW